ALADEGVEALLKWPNDVLLSEDDGRKVCGILCQGRPDGQVVVGIGINVGHDRATLPVETATSLRVVGARVDRTDLAAGVLTHLRQQHAALTKGGESAAQVRAAYAAACATLGRTVVVHHPDGTRQEVETTDVDL